MIRFLPYILVAFLALGGLAYWRYHASSPSLTSSKSTQTEGPIEVPSTLPEASIEDRVKALENLTSKIVGIVNSLRSQITTSAGNSSTDTKSAVSDASITELKARVTALEKATPAPVYTSSKSTVYIPLGSGGGPWADLDWHSLPEYEISLDGANYPGYSGMNLEIVFKMSETIGTASVRLYNVTDSTATSPQVDTTSSSYVLQATSSFKLATGIKTYRLQVKSSQSRDIFIQSARIKVNF